MQYELHITQQQLDLLLEHAERERPSESVALLFGRVSGFTITVESVKLVENAAEIDSNSFFVDPEVQYRIMMEEEAAGRVMVCIFHSHPAPATPSSRDLHNMRLNPVVWLIASKISGTWETASFILLDDALSDVRLVTSDS